MATHMMDTRVAWSAGVARGAADWICLGAAPTFAVMALLTSVLDGGAQHMICSTMPGMSPLSGMAAMYMLMAAFHSVSWLKLIAGRRGQP